jgi:hypothetical protein
MRKTYFFCLFLTVLTLACKKDKAGKDFVYNVSGVHNMSIPAGKQDTLQLQAVTSSGTPENLSISVAGMPSGVTATYSAASGTPNFNTTISFAVGSAVSPGNYPLQIIFKGEKTGDKTLDMNLNVTQAIPEYTIAGLHDVTIQQGVDDQLSLTIQAASTIQERIDLSIWGLPAGVTADIGTSSGMPSYNSTIVFTDHYGVPGNYSIKLIAHGTLTGDITYSFNLHILQAANCGVLGFWSQGTTGCGNNTTYQYTDNVTTSTAAANRIIFANFADMPYQVYADVDCANSTLTIPNQFLPNGIQVAGSGTFTANTIHVDFSQTSTTNITTYCNFTLIR